MHICWPNIRAAVLLSQKAIEKTAQPRAVANSALTFCERGGAAERAELQFIKIGASDATLAPTWLRGWDLNHMTFGLSLRAACGTRLGRAAASRLVLGDRCARLCLAASPAGRARQRAPTSYARRSHNKNQAVQFKSVKEQKSNRPLSESVTFLLVAGMGFEPHDLRVMSPTSYQTAPPRDISRHLDSKSIIPHESVFVNRFFEILPVRKKNYFPRHGGRV